MEEAALQLVSTTIDTILLKSILGSGSFAVVFLGLDQASGQECAVKVLFKHELNPSQVKLQRKECTIMKRVSHHPNIVSLYNIIETDSHIFLVMERCELDLYDAIIQKNGFPCSVVKEIFLQLLDALSFCHVKHVYHRDIKPENILISEDFKVKFADFGLATVDSWSHEYGCGSVRYMAPECIGPDKAGSKGYSPAATDVWAMGILLINLLSGKNPWHEATPDDPIYSLYTTTNPHILQEQFNLTNECHRLLTHVLHPNPAKRCSLPEFKFRLRRINSFLREHDSLRPEMERKHDSLCSVLSCYSSSSASMQPKHTTPPPHFAHVPPAPINIPGRKTPSMESRTKMSMETPCSLNEAGTPSTNQRGLTMPNFQSAATILKMEMTQEDDDDDAAPSLYCISPVEQNLDTLLPSPLLDQPFKTYEQPIAADYFQLNGKAARPYYFESGIDAVTEQLETISFAKNNNHKRAWKMSWK